MQEKEKWYENENNIFWLLLFGFLGISGICGAAVAIAKQLYPNGIPQ